MRVTGIGLGNFSTGFTEYNRLNIRYFYNEAHCDYLQFVIETGLVGVLLLAFVVLLRRLRRDDVMGVSFAFVTGCGFYGQHGSGSQSVTRMGRV